MTSRGPKRDFTDLAKQDVATLAGGAGISLGGKIVGRGLAFLGDVVAARILGPESFGFYAVGWTILRTVSMISPLGLEKGVIYFAAPLYRRAPAVLKRILNRILILSLISGLAVGGVQYFMAPVLAEQVFHKPELTDIFRWYALAYPLIGVLNVAAAGTRITKRMHYSALLEDMGPPAVGFSALLLLLWLGFRLTGVLASDIVSFAVPAIASVVLLRRLFPNTGQAPSGDMPSIRALLAFSIPASLAGVFTPFLIWVDRLIVGHFRTPVETGIYQVVSQTSTVFAIILTAFAAIFMPIIADLYSQKEFERLEALFRVSTKWGLYISLPVFVVLCFLPREILIYAFDNRYAAGCLPLVILSIGQLVNVGTGAVGPLLVMTGHQKRWLILSGAALATNILLNWHLVPRFGLTGAAASTAVSLSGLFILGILQIRSTVRMWPYDRRYLKGLAAACLSTVPVWISHVMFPVRSLAGLILISLAVGLVFLAVLAAFGLDQEDREFLHRLMAAWNSRKSARDPNA